MSRSIVGAFSTAARSAALSTGKLKVDVVAGSQPQVICDIEGRSAGTWNSEGVIAFPQGAKPLHRVSADGGTPTPILSFDAAREETYQAAPHLVVETKGNSLHITNSQGDQKLSEIECKPGAECEGTASGKKSKVAMYFSGPTLVQLETVGSDVIKRQFTVREQPDILELEVTPIIGNAKSETLHLKRMPLPTGGR